MRVSASLAITLAAGLWSSGNDCVPVASATMRASDLASVVPAFALLDPDTPLAAAPSPGVRRVAGPQEIRAWARRAGIESLLASAVCFQRTEAPLDTTRVESTVAKALVAIFGAEANLSWKVVSFRPAAVPAGELVFLRGGLTKADAGLGAEMHLWRGRLGYDDGRHSLPVVVTLRLARRSAIAKAASDLEVRTVLEVTRMTRAEIEESPLDLVRSADPARLAGRTLRRPVAAGQMIALRDLEPVYAVERGADVTAEVSIGGARIAIPAVAQTSASAGRRVWVRNPDTKKTLAGRAVGQGRVEVQAERGPQAGARRMP